jgi:arginyl-tRNA synthetase
VTRYFFLMRRAEAQLTFDLDLALDQSDKNPVYKVQYAHARMCSIFRGRASRPSPIDPDSADLGLLTHRDGDRADQAPAALPGVVEAPPAARAALLCDYLEEVAGAVNSWYHAGNLDPSLRVVGVPNRSRARGSCSRAPSRSCYATAWRSSASPRPSAWSATTADA